MTYLSATWLILIVGNIAIAPCYSFLPNSANVQASIQDLSISALNARSHPEYSFDDGETENDSKVTDGGDYFSVTLPKEIPKTSENASQRPEYGALAKGTVVQVQVGDVSLARKAWKKRRRTGSPLLVPCSVLNVDRQSMVRWNLIFLLEKFGSSVKDGIQISFDELSKKYRSFLKSSLQKQANALSFESTQAMVQELFNAKVQEAYGIRLVEQDDQLILKAPISRHKAHQRTAKTPVLQFRLHREGDHGDSDTLTHTGFLRAKNQEAEDRSYHFLPLSAALRVSQKDDVDSGRVVEGSIHPAVIFDYDLIGDGGSPLLTLSLNPRGTRETLKVKPDRKYLPIDKPRCTLDQLVVGEGPYRAKVVKLLPRKALVDMEVGRKVSDDCMVKVLGSLQYKDSVEVKSDNMVAYDDSELDFDDDEEDDYEDDFDFSASLDELDDFADDEEETEGDEEGDLAEQLLSLRANPSFEDGTFEDGEEEEDISDLFEINEDGSLTYSDPETGETTILNADSDEDEEEVEEEEVSTVSRGFGRVAKLSSTKRSTSTILDANPKKTRFASKRLRVGEIVDVYIRSVSKQSGQFTVTTNPTVRGRKAKELKKETDADKKLQRLRKSVGGSLDAIYKLEGKECNGVVKATSKTGDWVYVQPDLSGLPVGVATFEESIGQLAVGDCVRIRINGIDEDRGQLALQVLDGHSA